MNYQDHDNEAEATRRIGKALTILANGRVIDTATARLIAACLHAGPSSALFRFASSGELDRTAAITELQQQQVRPIWREALRRYLAQ
ncbi:MAG: hypothetical protein JWP19_2248 [Rhodoglobus sp.]|jgi:hypothetical protein|nr:hypothetical protein [Rhodoglobus sp.]